VKPSRLKGPADFWESKRQHDDYVSWLIEQCPRWRAEIRRWRLKDSAVDEDDLAQQLALVALELKPRLEPMVASERSAYMMTVGRHLAQGRIRFQRGALSLDDLPEIADSRSAGDESSDDGRIDQLMDRTLAAVEKLSTLQRGALYAKYVLGLKSPQAALYLRSTPLAVRKAVSRGIQQLRAINGHEDRSCARLV
jgi:DNA-directed RNA polymerase specialized sigma24 family protein